jgi:two-component system sensor histidine kinase KdpD
MDYEEVRLARRRTAGWVAAVAGPPLLTVGLVGVAGPPHATNVAFAYLLVVLAAAALGGVGPGATAGVASFLLFNFYFIEPLGSLTVSARGDVGVLGGFLVTALVVSALLASVERRRAEAERQADDARLLYDLSITIAEPAGANLATLAEKAERRLGLDHVAVATSGQAGLDVVRARDEAALRDAVANPHAGHAVARRPLAAGGDLVLVGFAREGHEIDERQRALVDAIAALSAAAADHVEQQRQRQHVEVLQETDRQRSALLAAVSHDLRTPLMAMTAAAGALDDAALPPQQRSALARSIVVEGERLDRMVRNLLDLGRIEGGALAADREVVPVDELVGVVLTRVRPRLDGRTLAVTVPGDLPAVLVDPTQIDQVLGNLVENTLVHTPPTAGLTVSARPDGRYVTIRVADEGPGIAPQHAESVFERFFRGGTSSRGSGLGLAIARAYATANDATLDLVPTSSGTAFDLRLPAVEAG